MEKKTIGKFIAVLRKSQGMTQKELAQKLGVSDKTVSHWERDESAPDISLIPVIAEIFSVSCDELLRGEKSAAQSAPSDTYREKEMSEKQIEYRFEKALNRLKTKSFICAGISALGLTISLVVTYIIHYHLHPVASTLMSARHYTGVFCAFPLYIVSLTLAVAFRLQFKSCIINNFEEADLYIKKANFITCLTVGFTITVFCFNLPFSLIQYWFFVPIMNGARYAAICAVILVIIFNLLAAKGFIISKQHTKKQKKLFMIRMIIAVVTVCVLTNAAVWEVNFINLPVNTDFTKTTYYDNDDDDTDIDAFIDLMTTPRPIPDYIDEATRLEIEERMSQKEYTITVDGKEYRFEWKNGKVISFYQTDDFDSIDVTLVRDARKDIEKEKVQKKVKMAGYVIYPAVILLAVSVYIVIKRKIERSEA